MERLTERTNKRNVKYAYSNDCFFNDGHVHTVNSANFRKLAIERLAAYEDSGITPEEVAELAKIVRCRDCVHFCVDTNGETYCDSIYGLTDPYEHNFCSYGKNKGQADEE